MLSGAVQQAKLVSKQKSLDLKTYVPSQGISIWPFNFGMKHFSFHISICYFKLIFGLPNNFIINRSQCEKWKCFLPIEKYLSSPGMGCKVPRELSKSSTLSIISHYYACQSKYIRITNVKYTNLDWMSISNISRYKNDSCKLQTR